MPSDIIVFIFSREKFIRFATQNILRPSIKNTILLFSIAVIEAYFLITFLIHKSKMKLMKETVMIRILSFDIYSNRMVLFNL